MSAIMWAISYKGKIYGEPMDKSEAEAKMKRLESVVKGLELVKLL